MRLIAATFLVIALTVPCNADEFCDGLKKVVSDAPNEFSTVRGAPENDDPTQFSQPLLLAGSYAMFRNSPPCEVSAPKSLGQAYKYLCNFPASALAANGKKEVMDFTARVAGCLNLEEPKFDFSAPHDADPMRSSNRGPFLFVAHKLEITTGLEYPPDGGGGTLYLTIVRAPA